MQMTETKTRIVVDDAGWVHLDWHDRGLTPIPTQLAFNTLFVECRAIIFVAKIEHDLTDRVQALRSQASEFINCASALVAQHTLIRTNAPSRRPKVNDGELSRLREKQTNTYCPAHALNALLNRPAINSVVLFSSELLVTPGECKNDVKTTARELVPATERISQVGFRFDGVLFICHALGLRYEVVYRPADVLNPDVVRDPLLFFKNLPNGWTVPHLEGCMIVRGNHFTFLHCRIVVDDADWVHLDWHELWSTSFD